MYNEFYNLILPPFQISSDPAFMWFGEKHQEALATLQYGILDNKGFLLLTGDVGTGKTSLINSLIQNLEQDIICTSVPDPSLEKLDLFNYIAASFGMDREFTSKGAFLAHFKEFLLSAEKKNKKVLLIIDEAQLLTQEMLEEIRLLSNIEKPDAKLINIFFIGQNEFNEILNRPQNRAVLQRMTLNYNLDPLTTEEVDQYIRHRLKVAGTQERLFDMGAVQEIYLYSGGFPRRINILCDHALLSGFVREQRVIDAGIVRECAKELKIPAYVRNRDLNGLYDSVSGHDTRPKPVTRSSGPAVDPVAPVQQPVAPTPLAPPVSPQPPPKQFSWATPVILVCFFLFAWYFMFPQHFLATVSQLQQAVVQKGEIVREQKTENKSPTGNQSVPQAQAPKVDNVSPLGQKTGIEKESGNQGQAHNAKEFVFSIAAPQKEPLPPEPEVEEPVPPLPQGKITVRFKLDANDLPDEDLEKLKAFAKIVVFYPESQILITGYTDTIGNANYNLKLSEFRANIVKSFLLGLGVGRDQMQARGRGGQNPVASNRTLSGRTMNRRVEIEVAD